MVEDNPEKEVVTDPTEPVNFNATTGVPSEEDLSEAAGKVLNRLRTKIQEEDNPIARMKLQEWRQDVEQIVHQYNQVKSQRKMMEEGVGSEMDMEKASVLQRVREQERELDGLVDERLMTLGQILDQAENNPTESLLEFVQEVEMERERRNAMGVR